MKKKLPRRGSASELLGLAAKMQGRAPVLSMAGQVATLQKALDEARVARDDAERERDATRETLAGHIKLHDSTLGELQRRLEANEDENAALTKKLADRTDYFLRRSKDAEAAADARLRRVFAALGDAIALAGCAGSVLAIEPTGFDDAFLRRVGSSLDRVRGARS